jgi:DNA processing protein
VGRIELLRVPGIAIVGSRNATPRGIEDAEALAHGLSDEGTCVVSGLALGIDAAAHRGALRARGSSAAVLGTGLDVLYPTANGELAKCLAREGCIMSEFPLGTPAVPGNFPRRNRLISGLVRGVVVIEAARRSGSLITARYAIEQGRDVFAVPGSIHSMLSKGCHELIKQGAKLVESAGEVLEEYRAQPSRAKPALSAAPADPGNPLLAAMGFAPVGIDELARLTGLAARDIATQLGRLEIEGRVARIAGGRFQQQRAAAQAARACVIE